jgi:hypothetical protein
MMNGVNRRDIRSAKLAERVALHLEPSDELVYTSFGGPVANSLQIELGTACGKMFRCSTMVVLDGGDSDILSQVTA